jgi:hypothetical protein
LRKVRERIMRGRMEGGAEITELVFFPSYSFTLLAVMLGCGGDG